MLDCLRAVVAFAVHRSQSESFSSRNLKGEKIYPLCTETHKQVDDHFKSETDFLQNTANSENVQLVRVIHVSETSTRDITIIHTIPKVVQNLFLC